MGFARFGNDGFGFALGGAGFVVVANGRIAFARFRFVKETRIVARVDFATGTIAVALWARGRTCTDAVFAFYAHDGVVVLATIDVDDPFEIVATLFEHRAIALRFVFLAFAHDGVGAFGACFGRFARRIVERRAVFFDPGARIGASFENIAATFGFVGFAFGRRVDAGGCALCRAIDDLAFGRFAFAFRRDFVFARSVADVDGVVDAFFIALRALVGRGSGLAIAFGIVAICLTLLIRLCAVGEFCVLAEFVAHDDDVVVTLLCAVGALSVGLRVA